MTVAELIGKLSKFPFDAEVFAIEDFDFVTEDYFKVKKVGFEISPQGNEKVILYKNKRIKV